MSMKTKTDRQTHRVYRTQEREDEDRQVHTDRVYRTQEREDEDRQTDRHTGCTEHQEREDEDRHTECTEHRKEREDEDRQVHNSPEGPPPAEPTPPMVTSSRKVEGGAQGRSEVSRRRSQWSASSFIHSPG